MVAATLGTAVVLLVLGLGVAQASKRQCLRSGRQDRRQSEGCTSTDDESDDTLLVIPKTHAKQEPEPIAAAGGGAAAAAFAGTDGGSAGAGPPELVMLNDAAHLFGTFGGTNISFDAGAGESGVLQHAESAFPSTARQYHTSQMHADGTAAAHAQVCTTAGFAALGAAAVHAATFPPATESSSHPLKELEKISSQFTASSVSASTSSSDDGEPMPEGAAASPSAVMDAMLDHNHDNLDVVKECEDLARELGVDCYQELDLTRACAVGDADSAASKLPALDDSDAAVMVKGGPNGALDGSNSEQALKVNGKWKDWVLNLTLKERNVLSLKHGFSEEEADHLKQSTRKYKRARAQRRYHKKRAVAAGNSHERSVSAHRPVLPAPADPHETNKRGGSLHLLLIAFTDIFLFVCTCAQC